MKKKMNDNAGIEGVPLQMLLSIIVATIALGVILTWASTISTPNVISEIIISPAPLSVYYDNASGAARPGIQYVNVSVKDSKGNPIADASVSFNGLGVQKTALTDADGKCIIDVSDAEMTTLTGTIAVTSEKTDYESKTISYAVLRDTG